MAYRYRSSEIGDPSPRELDLAELSGSDEDPGDLLSGGADIDDLIAAGVLNGDDDEREVTQDLESVELPEQPVLTREEALAQIKQKNEWLIAHGYRNPARWNKKEYSNVSSQPL
ncbi:MAG: hypothetical protein DCF15_06055 [Phormidesmis priestleyi]|uniref:Uncharacterized protein n=1 Tax=Phormidesmis priestleyi TaxID=268141 RepID=A0A2W4ZHI7_9CYAN|nr:MAG: hypothetical protein DCF15_06055 [Phormidesmis priestleyi]